MLRSTRSRRATATRLCACLGLTLPILGCEAISREPVEALSTKTTPEAVTEVQAAIAQIQGTPAPRIASNVFESSPHLLIEKGRVKGKNNVLLDGSYTDFPDQYTLQIRGTTCGLFHAKTDQFVPLTALNCEPVTKR
ncbi:hypothetical protein ACJO1P_24035 [Vibrio parahaemolyticus]|uniref:hypothetical protein n=1 Tax=Vibrio parahaemolyticus TaxID=670 RepID=UPI00387AA242